MRKRRSDRNHIIYTIENLQTNEIYIGITAVTGRAFLRSLQFRWKKHISRSKNESFDWNLYQSIRQWGHDQFSIKILEIVRGKSKAHTREVELIHQLHPQLNSTHKTICAH
jgi:hypothetical protein